MFTSRQTPVVYESSWCMSVVWMKISFGKLDFDGYILIWSHGTEGQFILAFSTYFSGSGWAPWRKLFSRFHKCHRNLANSMVLSLCWIDKKNKAYRMIRTIVCVRKIKPREWLEISRRVVLLLSGWEFDLGIRAELKAVTPETLFLKRREIICGAKMLSWNQEKSS